MATVSKWTPFGVALDITATSGTVTRTKANQFTVEINASWKTYYSGAQTLYGMTASVAGGSGSVNLNTFGNKSSGESGSFTGTFSISGNGSATKTITVTFKNYDTDNNKSATKTVSFNVTVPAWTSYTITYNANGGTGVPSKQTKWKDQNLTLSSTKPTRTGYSFQGWATSASGSVAYKAGASYKANSAVTLYAVWEANTYTVSYNANGGSLGNVSNQTKIYGVTLKLESDKPTRTGYNFKGWAITASGSVVYNPGDSYTANAAITLYAVWVLAYQPPRITNFSATRNGTNVDVKFNWVCDLLATGVKISWESADGDIKGSENFLVSSPTGTKGSFDATVGSNQLVEDKTFTITATVADSNGSSSKRANISTLEFPIEAVYENGKCGVAVGKAAELVDTFDVGYDAKFRGSVSFDAPAAARTNLKAWCFDNTTNTTNSSGVFRYPGLAHPDGTTLYYVRTTQQGLLPYESNSTNGSGNVGTSGWPFASGHFKNLYANGFAVADYIADSGWKTATLSSDFVKYDNNDENIPQYIKIGKLVQVRGSVSPKTDIAGSTTAYTIFTLPEGYRPPKQVSVVSPGSGAMRWLLTITASGEVRFQRYNNGAGYVTASTNAWLSFHTMYFVD